MTESLAQPSGLSVAGVRQMNGEQRINGQGDYDPRWNIRPSRVSNREISPKQQNTNVLIVDDDQLFTRQLVTGLERHGFSTFPSDNRVRALETVHSHRPDFAVLELRLRHDPLAHHGGLELVAELRKMRPQMRIVVATSYSSIVTAVAAIKAGAAEYLPKPASLDSVATALNKSGQMPCLRDKPMSADRLRWEYILRTFFQCDQNVSATARTLGMHRRTLQRMLNKRPPPE